MDDDTAVLLAAARQESRNVHQRQNWNIETVAETYETGRLAGSLNIQHARQEIRLVGDDTHRHTAHAAETDDDILGEIAVYFEELPVVHDGFDYLEHIVRLVGVVRNQLVQTVFQPVDRVGAVDHRCILQIVGRQVRQQLADNLDTFFLALHLEVGDARFGGVNPRTAQVLRADIFAGNGLYHLRTGNEHVGCLVGHQDEVRQGGRINGSSGAGAENGGNLRNHSGSQNIAFENFGVAGQRGDTLLNTGTAGIVQSDDRSTGNHGLVHHLADFLRQRFRQGAAEYREILCEHEYQTSVDGTLSGYHAVAQEFGLLHAEIGAPVRHEHVEFFKTAVIQQHFDTLTGCLFPFLVLGLDPFFTAA